jgi:hypothetical protein
MAASLCPKGTHRRRFSISDSKIVGRDRQGRQALRGFQFAALRDLLAVCQGTDVFRPIFVQVT